MNTNQLAVIECEFKKNDQRISAGLLATLLGKRKDNVIRKIEKSFSQEQLLKMRNCSLVAVGNGGHKASNDYLLPRKEAVALAMMYDINIGMGLLTALETLAVALMDISKVTQ